MRGAKGLQSMIGAPPPWIVGILNLTPDSFSGNGRLLTSDAAVLEARRMWDQGAHVVEVGGESTRPGARPVSAKEELERVAEVVKVIAAQGIVAIDTYKAETAEVCLGLGARIINDVSALRTDPHMAEVIKRYESYLVLMHSKQAEGAPHATLEEQEYLDVVEHIIKFLEQRVAYAKNSGIPSERIILDPGMGRFISHDPKYSWEVLKRMDQLVNHFPDIPFMISTSRKGFMPGPLASRDPVSQLTALVAWKKGASLLRTHNVKQLSEYIDIWQRLW